MDLEFTIATLTCNNRSSIFKTITDVCENTDQNGLNWTIFAQGCSDDFLEKIKNLFAIYPKIRLHLYVNSENLGCSRGFNRLWTYIEKYKYVLLLEDDWFLLQQEDKQWLHTSLELMNEHSEVDIIYYRKYENDQEKWQYGWTRHIPYICFQGRLRFNYAESMKRTHAFDYKGHKFQQIPEFMYTNNPCLYRVESYKKRNIYPLPEMDDRHSLQGHWTDSSFVHNWGASEALTMEKTHDCYVLYMDEGLFVHNFK